MSPLISHRVPGLADEPTEEIVDSANSLWETLLDGLPRAGVAIALVLVGWAVSRGVRWGLERVWRRRQTPSFARVMSKVVGWVVLVVVVLLSVAITFPSVRPVDLLAGLGFFSVAVGFAFQDILENSLAGVLLLFRQPFRGGDQIRVADQVGVVESITIRETRIRSFDNELIVIPNRDVYKNVIVVATDRPVTRQVVRVGVAYGSDLSAARETIARALSTVDSVADVPAPKVLVAEFGVSTIDIDVMFWADSRRADTIAARSAAIDAVARALDEAGFELPASIVELEARSSVREALAEVAGGQRAPAGMT